MYSVGLQLHIVAESQTELFSAVHHAVSVLLLYFSEAGAISGVDQYTVFEEQYVLTRHISGNRRPVNTRFLRPGHPDSLCTI